MNRVLIVLAVAAALLLGATNVVAQGTPEAASPGSWDAPLTPSASECTATAASTDDVAALLATPVAAIDIPLTSNGLIALPGGPAASEHVVQAVTAVLNHAWACNNAGNLAAELSLFSDEGIQNAFGSGEPAPFGMEDLRADVAARLTPGEPRAEGELASIEALAAVVTEADGSIGVLILNSDPLVAEGRTVLDYFQLTLVDGTYMISDLWLDPFDLTPDYGFEASA